MFVTIFQIFMEILGEKALFWIQLRLIFAIVILCSRLTLSRLFHLIKEINRLLSKVKYLLKSYY